MDMRLRFPELFDETGVKPYRLAVDSNKRISLSTAYRLKREGGKLQTFKAEMLDAICDVMQVTPAEIWERDSVSQPPKTKRRTPEPPAVPKRKKSERAA